MTGFRLVFSAETLEREGLGTGAATLSPSPSTPIPDVFLFRLGCLDSVFETGGEVFGMDGTAIGSLFERARSVVFAGAVLFDSGTAAGLTGTAGIDPERFATRCIPRRSARLDISIERPLNTATRGATAVGITL